MIAPFVLLLLSVLGMALTWEMPDAFLLAVLTAIASVLVFLRAVWGKRGRTVPPPKAVQKMAVIDGSNVMYWRDGTPQLNTVKLVVQQIMLDGFTPGVMFDANAGYLLEDRYIGDMGFAKRLGLSKDHVMVVPKGVQADAYILKSARDLGAVIVTNDRFRDWYADYPEAAEPGHLIQGGFRGGFLWLDLPA